MDSEKECNNVVQLPGSEAKAEPAFDPTTPENLEVANQLLDRCKKLEVKGTEFLVFDINTGTRGPATIMGMLNYIGQLCAKINGKQPVMIVLEEGESIHNYDEGAMASVGWVKVASQGQQISSKSH